MDFVRINASRVVAEKYVAMTVVGDLAEVVGSMSSANRGEPALVISNCAHRLRSGSLDSWILHSLVIRIASHPTSIFRAKQDPVKSVHSGT